MTTRKIALALLTFALITACSDEPTTPAEQPRISPSASALLSSHASDDELADALAAQLALQLSDIGFQAQVRDLLRSSPWVEHKVLVEDLLESRVGESLLRAVAAQVNSPVEDIQNNVRRLPPLDFYVPLDKQRSSWRPGDALVVGYVPTNKDTLVDAYLPSAEIVRLTKTSLRTTDYTLFLLQPAESKNKRFGSGVPTIGASIQDPGEFRIGGSYTVVGEDGTIESREFSDLPLAVKPPVGVVESTKAELAHAAFLSAVSYTEDFGVAASFSSYPKGTYLNTDQLNVEDGIGGDCEIYTYQSLYSGSGTRLTNSRVPSSGSLSGVPCDEPYIECDAFSCWEVFGPPFYWWDIWGGFGYQALGDGIDGSEYLKRHMFEDDSVDDDDLGKVTFDSSHYGDSFCYHKDDSGNVTSFTDYCYYNYEANGRWEAAMMSHW